MPTDLPTRYTPKTVPEMIGHALRRMATYLLACGLFLIVTRDSTPSARLPANFFTLAHALEILCTAAFCFVLGVIVERYRPRADA